MLNRRKSAQFEAGKRLIEDLVEVLTKQDDPERMRELMRWRQVLEFLRDANRLPDKRTLNEAQTKLSQLKAEIEAESQRLEGYEERLKQERAHLEALAVKNPWRLVEDWNTELSGQKQLTASVNQARRACGMPPIEEFFLTEELREKLIRQNGMGQGYLHHLMKETLVRLGHVSPSEEEIRQWMQPEVVLAIYGLEEDDPRDLLRIKGTEALYRVPLAVLANQWYADMAVRADGLSDAVLETADVLLADGVYPNLAAAIEAARALEN